jgi:hypothetical protein
MCGERLIIFCAGWSRTTALLASSMTSIAMDSVAHDKSTMNGKNRKNINIL